MSMLIGACVGGFCGALVGFGYTFVKDSIWGSKKKSTDFASIGIELFGCLMSLARNVFCCTMGGIFI